MTERPDLSKPRPPKDQNIDPVEGPAVEAPEPAAEAEGEDFVVFRRKKREPLFPYSTRLSDRTIALIEQASAQEGKPQRQIVEEVLSEALSHRVKKSK